MNPEVLLAWLLSLPPVTDAHGYPFRRPEGAARTIVKVALEHPEVDPRVLAATLDVLAARESRYRPHAAGDCPTLPAGSERCTRELGARSFGAYQTPIAETPPDALGQTRLAASILLGRALNACPEHIVWAFASGHCAPSRIAREYEALIAKALAVPLPAVEPAKYSP